MKTDLFVTTQSQSDLELVRSAQEGNAEAFAELFDAHKSKVYSLCLRMTSNAAEAEDLMQAAFLQVFRKLGSFRGESSLSTWLYRVTVNTVLMHFRKKSTSHISLDTPGKDGDAPKREPLSLDRYLAGSVDRIALMRAMKELPKGYRTILVLHEVEGYEHHEIARMLRCSVGTSKSQLHKAKAKMRDLLGLALLRKPANASKRTLSERNAKPTRLQPALINQLAWSEMQEAA